MSGAAFIGRMRRPDKFQLSGGRLMFAPRYPRWLRSPGFWDGVYYHDEELAPVFTFALLEDGREVELFFRKRLWRPGKSVTFYRTKAGLRLEETRFITPDGQVTSLLSVADKKSEKRVLDLVLWTRQNYGPELPSAKRVEAGAGGITFLLTRPGRRAAYTTRWKLAADREADSFAATGAECLGPNPSWDLTPFAGGWDGALNSSTELNCGGKSGALWCALHYRLHPEPGGSAEIALFAAIAAHDSPGSEKHLGGEMLRRTTATWERFFDGVPDFRCSEPLWEHLYRYRWYLIRQNLKVGGETRQPFDGVCEGPDIFHQPISYSTPPIIFDLRWHQDPDLARRQLLNFCLMQEKNGRLPGALHHDIFRDEFFYHADWGRALERLDEVHPDKEFLEKVYPALGRYCRWLARERDAEGSGMIDVISHYETGQEFSSRYLPARSGFDTDEWLENIQLKGVDATVYAYFLQQVLEATAIKIGRDGEKERWHTLAARTRSALLERMWQPDEKIFSDLLPENGMRPTGVRALTNFYPFLTDIVGSGHVKSLFETLLDPREFWTRHPAATLSRTDPHFDAGGVWRGKLRNCPWNGRVWPMTNSHIVEVLAEASRIDGRLREFCAELLWSFARLFSPSGDPRHLSSYEHYNPQTGSPSAYRGIDDYLHCWMIDLIIRYVAGFRPEANRIIVDPFPLGAEKIKLAGLPFRGEIYDLKMSNGRVRLYRDGRLIARGRPPIECPLDR